MAFSVFPFMPTDFCGCLYCSVFFISSSLPFPLRYLDSLRRSSRSLLFSRLNNPSSLSLSSYHRCSNTIIFMTLHWTMSLLYWGAQHWTQHPRCVLPVLSREAGSPTSTCSLYTLPNITEEAVGLVCHGEVLLNYGQLVHQGLQELLC